MMFISYSVAIAVADFVYEEPDLFCAAVLFLAALRVFRSR